MSGSFFVSMLAGVTLATGLSLVASRLARRSRAALRHVLLAGSFAVLAMLPIASLVVPSIPVPVPMAATSDALAPAVELITDAVSPEAPAIATTSPAPRTSRALRLPPLPALLLAGWMAGAVVFLLPVIVGLWQIRTLRRSGLPWSGGESVAARLASELAVRRRVDVLLHEGVAGPMTSGVLHPTILLPMDAGEWPAEDLDRAIVHELEHVRRRDWLSQCLARVICAGYWFHPLVWIARQQLGLEAERACDDAVLQRGEATGYADQLVGLAKRLSAAHRQPLLAMANRRDLAARVHALLDGRLGRGRAGAAVIVLVCLASAALAVTMSPWRVVAAGQTPSPQVVAAGQTPSSPQSPTAAPRFDVVSVRPCDPKANPSGGGRGGWAGTSSPGRLRLECQSLYALIHMAYVTFGNDRFNASYAMPEDRGLSLPDWAHSGRYTIEGKADGEPTGVVTRGSMLRAVLEDRFKLKMHRETRAVPTQELVVAKGGPKLTPLEPGACVPYDWSGFPQKPLEPGQVRCMNSTAPDSANNWVLTAEGSTLDALAGTLTSSERLVVNKTGLQGYFTFRLVYRGGEPGGAPPFETALKAQLGLELRPAKGTREFFVLDHVERPTPDGPFLDPPARARGGLQ
jgi:uncharacterized protein (TIGR03435 family)